MTKVTILGQEETPKPREKIKFEYILDEDGVMVDEFAWEPSMFSEIVLLQKSYTDCNLDLMYCVHSDERQNLLILGHFNDGVV